MANFFFFFVNCLVKSWLKVTPVRRTDCMCSPAAKGAAEVLMVLMVLSFMVMLVSCRWSVAGCFTRPQQSEATSSNLQKVAAQHSTWPAWQYGTGSEIALYLAGFKGITVYILCRTPNACSRYSRYLWLGNVHTLLLLLCVLYTHYDTPFS